MKAFLISFFFSFLTLVLGFVVGSQTYQPVTAYGPIPINPGKRLSFKCEADREVVVYCTKADHANETF